MLRREVEEREKLKPEPDEKQSLRPLWKPGTTQSPGSGWKPGTTQSLDPEWKPDASQNPERTRKLAMQRGETMAESLLAILLIALSVSMFFNVMILSGRIMDKAKKEEKQMRMAMALLERMEEDCSEEGLVKKNDFGKLKVSIHTGTGRLAAKEEFAVSIYDSKYGTVYRWEE